MKRHFYNQNSFSNRQIQNSYLNGNNFENSPRGRAAYTNVYKNFASNLHNNSSTARNPQSSAYFNQQRPTSHRSISQDHFKRQHSMQRNSPRQNPTFYNSAQRIRSNSQLKNAQPKTMLDTLMRKMPIQRSRSHSKQGLVGVHVSQRTSVEKSIQRDSEDRLGSNPFLNIPKVQTNYDSEQRLGNNPFLNIPKVQTNYGAPAVSKRRNRKKEGKKAPKMGLREKLKLMNSTLSIRQNPIIGKHHLKGKKLIVSKNGFPQQKAKKIREQPVNRQMQQNLKGYQRIQKQVNMKNLFQKTQDLGHHLRLDANIFEPQPLDSSPILSTSMESGRYRSSSRLENYLQKQKKIKKPRVVHKPNQFGLLSEMWAKQKQSFETEETDGSGDTAQRPGWSKSVSRPMIRGWAEQRRNPIIEEQLQQISESDLKDEINKFVGHSSKSRLIGEILTQNQKLEERKRRYLEMRPFDLRVLKEKVARKKREVHRIQQKLWEVVTRLKKSGKLSQSGMDQQTKLLTFEKNLGHKGRVQREKLVHELQKCDKRCKELKDEIDNVDFEMAEKYEKKMENQNKEIMIKEEKILLESLEDESEKNLVNRMRKMLRMLEEN